MFSLILFGFILAGALMKLTDDLEDRELLLPEKTDYLTGIAYGAVIGLLMVFDENAAHLFSGIIIGCLVTNKIDAESHYLALGTILLIVFSKGLVLSMPLVLTITVLAAIDELTSNPANTNALSENPHFVWIYSEYRKALYFPIHLKKILDYRVVLKIGIVLMVVLEIVHWSAAVYLLSFDASYIVMSRILTKFEVAAQ